MFSVLILTKDEAANLPGCLASVNWCDDVVVLDSFSADQTIALAQAGGTRIFQRVFDDFAGQRNFALDHIPFKHPWVFHLDADEHFTPELHVECMRGVQQDRFSGFQVPNKLMFMGRWLRHAGMYPSYQVRLLKIGELRFVQHGHGQRETEARRGLGKLSQPYLHYNFSKGLDDWWRKHERYAEQEAAESMVTRQRGLPLTRLLSSEAIDRRRALKELSFRLPCRPMLRFLYMYLLRLGFLDGIPGYHYCRLLAIYEYMIVLKMKEIRRRQVGLPI